MSSTSLIAKTPNNVLLYNAYFMSINARQLDKYVNSVKFCKLCEIGCINYDKKWSCPPFSPSYINFSSEYHQILICFLTIDMEQFSYIKNSYLKIKTANTILKSRIDKTFRIYSLKESKYISNGSCRLCKPCKCKSENPCSHPNIMTYSFEALGIDVGKLVEDIFDKKLLWYSKNKLPQYTSVVSGLLFNQNINLDEITEILISQN